MGLSLAARKNSNGVYFLTHHSTERKELYASCGIGTKREFDKILNAVWSEEYRPFVRIAFPTERAYMGEDEIDIEATLARIRGEPEPTPEPSSSPRESSRRDIDTTDADAAGEEALASVDRDAVASRHPLIAPESSPETGEEAKPEAA